MVQAGTEENQHLGPATNDADADIDPFGR